MHLDSLTYVMDFMTYTFYVMRTLIVYYTNVDEVNHFFVSRGREPQTCYQLTPHSLK